MGLHSSKPERTETRVEGESIAILKVLFVSTRACEWLICQIWSFDGGDRQAAEQHWLNAGGVDATIHLER